ncbi:AbrB/MazE/SpoVT family DNA-binding domain-containing protein [Bacillus idriensis]|jgi:AbrB family transcriptional regulator, transcriptional pleiotropic regulator of transition state genes|uniref:AbrB/MazE/SpoVT family DNA-binding domain-containing protein n=1 Tax=Metabacillus idriensis TaxID=324768 RepID=A0A6I2MHI9_9BACI|nr:AbrB/MazE/SpoVT family DNA-binding domain-containing protein [Metabacillus idriensis]MRX56587.1 AbrB/MazE/SpoVT family DNA-binding domain-containing protein [Metabacillus idriensis]
MKSTGVVRKVDELGRIVIPIELRRVLEIEIKDAIEIFVDDDKIILQKYMAHNACAITGEITNENRTYGDGKFVLSPKGAEILLRELEEAK